jgi:hypothetical protein
LSSELDFRIPIATLTLECDNNNLSKEWNIGQKHGCLAVASTVNAHRFNDEWLISRFEVGKDYFRLLGLHLEFLL